MLYWMKRAAAFEGLQMSIYPSKAESLFHSIQIGEGILCGSTALQLEPAFALTNMVVFEPAAKLLPRMCDIDVFELVEFPRFSRHLKAPALPRPIASWPTG